MRVGHCPGIANAVCANHAFGLGDAAGGAESQERLHQGGFGRSATRSESKLRTPDPSLRASAFQFVEQQRRSACSRWAMANLGDSWYSRGAEEGTLFVGGGPVFLS
eukprot:2118941-Pyramimonas_sp.AAC.1